MAKDPEDMPEDMNATKSWAGALGGSPVTGIAAGVMSGIWVVAVLAWVFTAPEGTESRVPGLVMTLLILFLPLALIWVAVVTLRLVADLRSEAASLKAAIDGMRGSFLEARQEIRSVITRPEAPVAAAPMAEPAGSAMAGPASFSSRRDQSLSVPSADRKVALTPARPEPEAEQPALALGTPGDMARQPLSIEDFITALQFPESPDDKAGFRALRLALEDREVAKLIRAAQDVLTLLSQEGIYMDDLRPELCHPDIWRRFSAGERGRGIAAIGGIRDRSSLALAAGRLREDTIFRDASHHFLRTFDRVFQVFEQNASDNELIHFADTRTARAFMVLGRVAGVFD